MNAIAPAAVTSNARITEWDAFLRPINLGVANPLGRQEFAARVASIAFALADVPAEMLTEWRQKEALRRFKFLPVAAELAEWLAPDLAAARDSRARREALTALPAPPRAEKTAAEIAAVRAAAQSFARDHAGAVIGGEPKARSTGHMSAEQLAASRAACNVRPLVKAAEA